MVDLLDSPSPLLHLFERDAIEREDFCNRIVGAVREFRAPGGDLQGDFILDDIPQGLDPKILGYGEGDLIPRREGAQGPERELSFIKPLAAVSHGHNGRWIHVGYIDVPFTHFDGSEHAAHHLSAYTQPQGRMGGLLLFAGPNGKRYSASQIEHLPSVQFRGDLQGCPRPHCSRIHSCHGYSSLVRWPHLVRMPDAAALLYLVGRPNASA